MEKLSLSKRIHEYLIRKAQWVHSGELERLAMEAGYKSSNAGRRCREMTSGKSSAGTDIPIVLERKEVNGSVWYRAIDSKIQEKPQRKVELIDGVPYLTA